MIAQYPQIESTGSIGSIILAILEVQVTGASGPGTITSETLPLARFEQVLARRRAAGCKSFRRIIVAATWTPKVCKTMAFEAVFGGFGLLIGIL